MSNSHVNAIIGGFFGLARILPSLAWAQSQTTATQIQKFRFSGAVRTVSAILARIVLGAIAALTLVLSASAEVRPFPRDFHTEKIKTDGATIHVRVGGQGPAVVMLHGFGNNGDMWAPLAVALVRYHTIIVPDLRGMGLSSAAYLQIQDTGSWKEQPDATVKAVREFLDRK